jgi:uncharacterized protein
MNPIESSSPTMSFISTPLEGGVLASLRSLYDEVDHQAAQIADGHGTRLQCRHGCCQCCVDDLTVFEVEAENIRLRHTSLLAQQEPHERGACAFLDPEGGCRIYADRPYVCRTQGLPLRWIDQGQDGELVELRDICPLNDEGTPIVELAADECWTIGPAEERLAELQQQFNSGQMTRVPLRSLFANRDSKEKCKQP